MYFFVHLQAHNYNSTADFTQCLEVMTKATFPQFLG